MDIESFLGLLKLFKLIFIVIVFGIVYYYLYNLWNFLEPYVIFLKDTFKWIWDRLKDLWDIITHMDVVVGFIKTNTTTAFNKVESLGSSITDIPNQIKKLLGL